MEQYLYLMGRLDELAQGLGNEELEELVRAAERLADPADSREILQAAA